MTSDPRIEQEAATVRNEIAGANTQASIALATVALAAGPVAANAPILFDEVWPITVLAVAGGLLAAVAVWFLLNVVLPRLDASGGGSFLNWAQCDREGLRAALARDYELDELLVLSRIAAAKYRALRDAGNMLKAALILLGLAALLSVIRG
ncbi:Pycsar system effector family protein [Actinoplanes sp. NPDC049681]|uniref:Pycsar system effector family protein n=1 Tax=Actinoplanes sp. NPDC049681 TaxID=3363905 RepID=UPI0037A35853